jgi:pimeloyl-ACP methyl ester carboxylesterase
MVNGVAMTSHFLVLILSAAIIATASGQSRSAARAREVVKGGGVAIEVIEEGRGPFVVLLASLGRDSEEMDPVAERIAQAGFRVLRPQPRGYERSVGPLDHITLHDLAKDVALVLQHENGGPAILAGHAYGHFVAKAVAVDFPQLTRGVVLISASQKATDPAVRQATAIATDPTRPEADRLKGLQWVFFAPGHDARIWLKGFHESVQKSEVIARDATPQSEYWSAGTVPILDLQAEFDPYRPASTRDELVKEFGAQRITTVLIKNAAHAVIVEQPREVADAIIAWAKRLP